MGGLTSSGRGKKHEIIRCCWLKSSLSYWAVTGGMKRKGSEKERSGGPKDLTKGALTAKKKSMTRRTFAKFSPSYSQATWA